MTEMVAKELAGRPTGTASAAGAIIVGVGRTNLAIASLLQTRGIPIIAAIGRGEHRLGRDLGVLAGEEPWDVMVGQSLPDRLKDTGPLVAFIATGSRLADQEEHLEMCARAGADVITLAEEAMAPWLCDPAAATRIDSLARRAGISILGSGHTDALWVQLPLLLAGVTGSLASIHGTGSRPLFLRDPGAAQRLALGERPGSAVSVEARLPESGVSAARCGLYAIAEGLGLEIVAEEVEAAPLTVTEGHAVVDHDGSVIEVAPGTIGGLRRRTLLRTRQQVILRFDDIQLAGASSGEEWTLAGEPGIEARVRAGGPNLASTAAQAANRIPTVVAAPPGLIAPGPNLGPAPAWFSGPR